MGFRVLVSRHPAIQATGRLTLAPVGLTPAEHTSLRWTHNRTGGFPASGFPIGFTMEHTDKKIDCKRVLRSMFPVLHSLIQQPPTGPVVDGVARIANHRDLPILGSTPKVRVLSSAGITRPQRSYDPVRLPFGPSPASDVEAATLARNGPPPMTRVTLRTCRVQYPGGSKRVHVSIVPRSRGLPRYGGGSASAHRLSRPAQTSLTLRLAQLLNRPRRPLSRGSSPASYPAKPLVSYRSKSTTLRVAPAATGHTRPRGALHKLRTANPVLSETANIQGECTFRNASLAIRRGPVWVISRNPQSEKMLAAVPSIADINFSQNDLKCSGDSAA